MTRGILTLACGSRRYLRMAEALLRSIRLRDAGIPVALATDQPGMEPGRRGFDSVIAVDPALGQGVEQKLHLDRYTPFDETLFIDSDCLVFSPPDALFEAYSAANGFGVIAYGELGPDDSHISIRDLPHFLNAAGIDRLPAFNGGIYFFDRSDRSREVFQGARELFARRDELGLERFKNAGAADEPIFAAAMRRAGVLPLPWDGAAAMGTALDCFDEMGEIDVMAGLSSFTKLGYRISPAVIHFNMNAQRSRIYRRECWRLKLGAGFPLAGPASCVLSALTAGWDRALGMLRRRLGALVRKGRT